MSVRTELGQLKHNVFSATKVKFSTWDVDEVRTFGVQQHRLVPKRVQALRASVRTIYLHLKTKNRRHS